MNIILNGEEFLLEGESSLSGLVEKLQLDVRKIAIEKNLEIIPRSSYSSATINEGDKIEIVSFIGGG
jgi:thiamine biosynthesis protein ThiS